MTRKCPTPDCHRSAAPADPGGTLHAYCATCERELLSNAWHDDARAGELRTSIVGGIPLDPEQAARDTGVFPLAS